MVHRREVDGQAIVLGNHGALWGNAMTWFDHETGSVWSQPLGEAILGPLTGQTLELLPSTLTRWGDWKAAHPDTLALDVASNNRGFELNSMALVIELDEESVAYPVPDLRTVGVANDEINGVAVAVLVSPDDDNWAVYSRTLDERVVELELDEDTLVEVGGDGRWDVTTGLGIDGTIEGLDKLPGFTSFPGDYVTFFPDGVFWRPDGSMVPAGEFGS